MVISAETFFHKNPLWKLVTLTDGALSKSYKSNQNEYHMECKKCGEQAQRRGAAKFACNRCRRNVSIDNDGKFTLIEPTGEKELQKQEDNMKREPKVIKLGSLDDTVVEETKRKRRTVEPEESDEPEEPVPKRKRVGLKRGQSTEEDAILDEAESEVKTDPFAKLGIEELTVMAAKTSGLVTDEEKERTKAAVKKRKERVIKKDAENKKADEKFDDEKPWEEEEPIKTIPKQDMIVPEKKQSTPRDKPDYSIGVVQKEVTLKPGEVFFIAELGIMVRAVAE